MNHVEKSMSIGALHAQAPMIVVLLDRDGTIHDGNSFFERLTGYRIDEVRGKDWFDTFFPERDRARARALFRSRNDGEIASANVNAILTRTGEERVIEWHEHTKRGADGRTTLAFGIDVTDRVRAERRLERLSEQAAVGLIIDDALGNVRHVNQRLCEMLGYSAEEILARGTTGITHPDDLEPARERFRAIERGDRAPYDMEKRYVCKDGSFLQGRVTVIPISDRGRTEELIGIVHDMSEWKPAGKGTEEQSRLLDLLLCHTVNGEGGQDQPPRAMGTPTDIDARKESAQRLASLLAEKETLLREVHHRVKNNIQIISSLLYFQAAKATNAETASAFEEVRRRLVAMGLVHQHLYESMNLSDVVLCDYIRAVVTTLWDSLGRAAKVNVVMPARPVAVTIDFATPLGMIVCELLVNASKYAWPDGVAGSVEVTLTVTDDVITLLFADDGVGFPPGFDGEAGASFGWRLITGLSAQMGGRIETWSERGARVRVTAPKSVALRVEKDVRAPPPVSKS